MTGMAGCHAEACGTSIMPVWLFLFRARYSLPLSGAFGLRRIGDGDIHIENINIALPIA